MKQVLKTIKRFLLTFLITSLFVMGTDIVFPSIRNLLGIDFQIKRDVYLKAFFTLFTLGVSWFVVEYIIKTFKPLNKEKKTELALLFLSALLFSSTVSYLIWISNIIYFSKLLFISLSLLIGLLAFWFIFKFFEKEKLQSKKIEVAGQEEDKEFLFGKWERFVIILVFIFGFFLRLYSAFTYEGFTDEFRAILAAKRYLIEGEFLYKRSLLTTYLTILVFKLFGQSVFIARLPSIIFGSFSILLIYKIARKVNKIVALASAYLFAISPLAIGTGSFAREYELYSFWTLLLINSILEIFDNKKKLKKKIKDFFLLLTPTFYLLLYILKGFDIGYISTFRAVFVILPIFLVFYSLLHFGIVFEYMKKKPLQVFVFLMLFLIIPSLAWSKLGILTLLKSVVSSPRLKDNYEFLLHFFPNSSKNYHWFSSLPVSNSFVLLILLTSSFLFLFKNKFFLNIALTFTVTLLLYYGFFSYSNIEMRYAYYLLPFYTIFWAGALYSLFKGFGCFKNIAVKWFCGFVFFILATVLLNPIHPIFLIKKDELKNIRNFNSLLRLNIVDFKPVLEYLKSEQVSKETVFITANPGLVGFYTDSAFIKKEDTKKYLDVFPIESQTNVYDLKENVYANINFKLLSKMGKIIKSNKKGYFLVNDEFRLTAKTDLHIFLKENEDFNIGEIKVKYIGFIGSMHVYKWDKVL